MGWAPRSGMTNVNSIKRKNAPYWSVLLEFEEVRFTLLHRLCAIAHDFRTVAGQFFYAAKAGACSASY